MFLPIRIHKTPKADRPPEAVCFLIGGITVDYKSTRWKKKRESILRRDEYRCTNCRRYGRFRNATTVHHICPVEFFPQYEWESWNLTSLCSTCHDKMHDRETHKLTAEGQRLLEKTSRAHGLFINNFF